MNPSPLLAGAAIQHVVLAAGLLVLRVRAPGETSWVVVAPGREGGVGLAASRPLKGAALGEAVGDKTRLRAALVGARVLGLGERGVLVDRQGAPYVVRFEGRPPRVSIDAEPLEASISWWASEVDRSALLERGAVLVRGLTESSVAARRDELARALDRAMAKLARRIEAVRGDLERIDRASSVALQASAFIAEAARVPRGAREMSVLDWSTGEPQTLTLKLDPARSAREQLDAMFRRARRLKLGREVADRRLADAERAREALSEVAEQLRQMSLDSATALIAMADLATAARAAAPHDFTLAAPKPLGQKRAKEAPRKPYRTFIGANGARILVGRGGADNDALTLHVARPQDLWLHVKDRAGAHVIVPLDKGASCPAEVLVDAALLAAHFGGARDETSVDIQYTPKKFLRKPKGSAPGFVVVDREKVLVLRLLPERVEQLLAAEVDSPRVSG